MSLPPAIKTVTVTFGRRFNLDGMTAVLAGTFELDQDLLWAATGDVLQKDATPASFDPETGLLSFEFPACDQTGFEDGQGNAVTNFRGILRATVNGRPIPALPFQVFEADMPGPVDLDFFVASSLVPGAVAQTTYVRSVGGLSGAVGLDTLADALAPYLPSPTPYDSGQVMITRTPQGPLGQGLQYYGLRRVGTVVFVGFNGGLFASAGSRFTDLNVLPIGFRPAEDQVTETPEKSIIWRADGSASIVANTEQDDGPVPSISWVTDDPEPTPPF